MTSEFHKVVCQWY